MAVADRMVKGQGHAVMKCAAGMVGMHVDMAAWVSMCL